MHKNTNVDHLEAAVDKYLAKEITTDKLATIAYSDPRLGNIVANNCTVTGLISSMDEIRHNAIIFFFAEYIANDKIKEGKGIYSLFYAIVQNLCREKRRENHTHEIRYVDLDKTISPGDNDTYEEGDVLTRHTFQGDSPLIDDSFEERTISDLDQQQAMEEFAEKMTRIPLPFAVELSNQESSKQSAKPRQSKQPVAVDP